MKSPFLASVFCFVLSVPIYADFITVIDLGANFRPTAVNSSGLIVGVSGNKGFIYNALTGQLQDANSFLRTGFPVDQINQLTGINNTGFYVGEGTVGGITHGIAGVYTVPEPSSLSLAAFAVSTFLLTNRRQRAGVQALAALRFNRSWSS